MPSSGDAVFFRPKDPRLRPNCLRAGIGRTFDAFHARQAAITPTDTCRCSGCVCGCKLGIKFVALTFDKEVAKLSCCAT